MNSKAIIIANLVLLLGIIGFQIGKKEKTLAEGKHMLFELAPVDPRSLMQGDYMTLSYAETRNVTADSIPTRGYVIVTLDENQVAKTVRIQAEETPLNEGEYKVKYFGNDWSVNIGAEAYFFEEGTGSLFEKAKYGGLRVAESGESLLVGLYDKDMKYIEPASNLSAEKLKELMRRREEENTEELREPESGEFDIEEEISEPDSTVADE